MDSSTETQPLTRRQRQRQATVTEILDAARAQMRRDGAAALNLNEVARQVGLRTPSLYEYFPGGKMEIYDAIFRLGIEIYQASRRKPAVEDDLEAHLRATMESYLLFSVEHPELYQICFERPVPAFVPSEESLAASVELMVEGRRQAEQVLRLSDNPLGLTADQAMNLVLAQMHGIASLHLANEPDLPLGEGRFGSLVPAATAAMLRAFSSGSVPVPAVPGDAQ